ncbi:MAG: histidine phosphatase family protein [Bacteroidales bacterium]|jgi:phosphohistidine phosphatase|nr:histidine phosphatase family protein [Bacteroidales bacterium]
MYKHLYFVRHGSSPSNSLSDLDRTLDEHGINNSLVMSERLSNNDILPDKILSSPAIRALQSATIFAQTFEYLVSDITINDEIYLANKNSMLNIIKQTDNKIDSLMIFGHNPTFTYLANHFLKDKISNMPPSGIVGLKLELVSWAKINRFKTISSFFDYP